MHPIVVRIITTAAVTLGTHLLKEVCKELDELERRNDQAKKEVTPVLLRLVNGGKK